MKPQHDQHFLDFINALSGVLEGHGDNTDELQKQQVNDLIALERQFRKVLITTRCGPVAYKAFIKHITEERRNILMARPFFRERNEVFKGKISKALRDGNYRALFRFAINFQFVSFVIKLKPWTNKKDGVRLTGLYEKIKKLRADLIECNLPLAISQARRFYSMNKNTHLAYMDLIQIASEGLIAAVDKFSGPYSKVFRAVVVGRVLGNSIEANSETFVHFYPADKRRIYRARKIVGSMKEGGSVDYAAVTKALNKKERAEGDSVTSEAELANLMAASAVFSANALPVLEDEEESGNAIERFAAESDCRPDEMLESHQLRWATANAIKRLPVLEQKVLRLRGVEF